MCERVGWLSALHGPGPLKGEHFALEVDSHPVSRKRELKQHREAEGSRGSGRWPCPSGGALGGERLVIAGFRPSAVPFQGASEAKGWSSR